MKDTESPTFTVSLLGKNAFAVFVSPSFLAVALGGPAYIAFVLACAAAAGNNRPTVAIPATVRNETINGAPLKGVGRQKTAVDTRCQAGVWTARRGGYGYPHLTVRAVLRIGRENSLAAAPGGRDSAGDAPRSHHCARSAHSPGPRLRHGPRLRAGSGDRQR